MSRCLVAVMGAAFMVIMSPTAGRSNPDDAAVEFVPIGVHRLAVAPSGFRDEAAMVIVGTGLLALAAAVRRST